MDIQISPDPVARARELAAEIVAAADEIGGSADQEVLPQKRSRR
jgi:hypothetical protein